MIQFGRWAPDRPNIPARHGTFHATHCNNGYMARIAWRPLPTAGRVDEMTGIALTSRPVAKWEFVFSDGDQFTFIETWDGALHRRDATDSGFTQVAPPSEDRVQWQLTQFGDAVYGVDGHSRLQKWTPATNAFADVQHAPVGAHTIAAVGDFLVLANFGNRGRNDVQWSGLNTPDSYEPDINSSGRQRVPDLGPIHDIIVFEDAYLVCEQGLVRMAFLAEGAYIWQFDVLSTQYGIPGGRHSIGNGRHIYAATNDGFIAWSLDGTPSFIGRGWVDQYYQTVALFEAFSEGLTRAALTFVEYDKDLASLRWLFRPTTGEPDIAFILSLEEGSWSRSDDGVQLSYDYAASAKTYGEAHSDGFTQFRIFEDSNILSFGHQYFAGGFESRWTFRPDFENDMYYSGPYVGSQKFLLETAQFRAHEERAACLSGVKIHSDAAEMTVRVGVADFYGSDINFPRPEDDDQNMGFTVARESARYGADRNFDFWVSGRAFALQIEIPERVEWTYLKSFHPQLIEEGTL